MTDTTDVRPARLSRRGLLGLGGAAVTAWLATACGGGSGGGDTSTSSASSASSSTSGSTSGSTTSATTASATTASATSTSTTATGSSAVSTGTPPTTVFTAADFAALGTCRVLPDLTQGPFPTIEQIERRDITEGHAGHPLRVGIQVVDETCVPIPGAAVEIWHCDVDGDYSAYADGYTDDDGGPGTTFLRGSQTSNAEGIVEFVTVYPGWYSGRAVHIHAKVHVDDATVLTTQFLFDDALNDAITAEPAYAAYGSPDTTNGTDGVTGGTAAADGLLVAVADDAAIAGSRALIVVGVDPSTTSAGASGGGMGGAGTGRGGPPGGAAPGR